MLLRPFLNDATSCASYLFGCGTHAKLAVVDPHAELVDDYLATAAALDAPIVAVFETHVRRRRQRLVDRGGPQSGGRPDNQERWAAMAYGRCTRATNSAVLGHERQRRRRERCLGRGTRRGLQHRALPDRGRRAHLASHDSSARVAAPAFISAWGSVERRWASAAARMRGP
jgi:hypothetical protein